ncbi:3' terminal RNA ribose 2'-O-methyltransferase Hen1 [Antrihabitans cavernicola]|uniref:Small RNA 2'-O-methyltransferase n=1 Tax=Antrihabitans cavernicola TaxID=2495913 RepID=A0A5A7S256_9NOCA|nr:3' terminal RNA ribose 2'-O-methyltransferase Hen1 [Spelaeibacter cavernicola]KAA0017961.1 3' terminal RNA ribose 2'-O-methyltransferase Hen1 [Spelaeibacter cavernicola]
MLVTVTAAATTDFPDTTGIGFLLHKHPDRVQTFELSVGTATVLYPESSQQRSTIAVVVDDAPASAMAVALSRLFKQTIAGVCTTRPELVDAAAELTIEFPAVPSRGGADLSKRLFGPLGWQVVAEPIPLDPQLPHWGNSEFVSLTLTGTLALSAALRHLYVLLPVLDDAKHYWVGAEEADKLVRAAGDWLGAHPESDLIASRYLAHRRELVASALDRLVPDAPDEPVVVRDPSLGEQRIGAVLDQLRTLGAKSVVDLGCGEGRLLRALFADHSFGTIVGADVSDRALTKARKRLRLDDLSDRERDRIALLQTSATYRDARLSGFDAMVLMEVIEHVDPPRLPALIRSVFAQARARTVLVTTPNAEYNALYPALAHGEFRHPDHRFEFTRTQFEGWGAVVASDHGYTVAFHPIGPVDEALGAPTQLAVFSRIEVSS